MRKIFLPIIILFIASCGHKTENKIKPAISNKKTGKHINIPGTRVFIIPPQGFAVSKSFIGLQKGEMAALNIYDLVGGNYYTNTASFNKKGFESQGGKVLDYQDIHVNGYPAKFVSLQGDPSAKNIGLVFGDSTFSTMIMCVYPSNDEATGKEILNSLNTILYDTSIKIDPFGTANFSLDESASIFKFFQYNANLYMYSVGGKDTKYDKEAPMVLISQFPKNNSSPKDIADMMIGKAGQYGLKNVETKNASSEKINGYDAYQAEIHGQIQDKNTLIYYCVLTKNDNAIVLQGIAKKDLETTVEEFRKMATAIKIK